MAVITIRLPERLRREMRRLRGINWSAVVRDSIKARVELESRMGRRDWERLTQANRDIDTIFEETQRKHGHIAFNSAETIRYWRDRRYGSTYWTRRSR